MGEQTKQCRNCETYKGGLCNWYNFGDHRPPKLFSSANKCSAFRKELTSDEVCQRCNFYISCGGHLGQSQGYCVVNGKPLPTKPIPEEVKAHAYIGSGIYACTPEFMSYAAPGFYGYDPSTIEPTTGLDHCDKFERRPKPTGGLIIAPLEKMSPLERLRGKPKARLCNQCGMKVAPKQRDRLKEFEYVCPKHGLFLTLRNRAG
ncbi:MAG TPA: hypothetical protein VMW64_08165 [Dehalococcoidia bacterium]|nr:hypothetical protein [Dehalococcoidia bacterium]